MARFKEIEKLLSQKEIDYKVIDLGGEAFTVGDVAAIIGNTAQIVKTLLVKTKGEHCPVTVRPDQNRTVFVALCLRGKDRVDFKKLKWIFGAKSEFASADEVLKVVGVPVGAVCPIGIGVSVIMDREVLKLKHVNLGSGDLTKGLEMDLQNLLKIVGHEAEDIRES